MPETRNPEGMSDTDLQSRIAGNFARQGMMQTLGAELGHVEPGRVVISAPITDALRQQSGVAHAGATFALADSAMGYAAMTKMEPDCDVVSIEVKINLMAPADGERLVAEGHVVRAGRQITVVRGEVLVIRQGESPKPVAVLQGTMMTVRPRT